MAYSTGSVSAGNQSAIAANKPLFMVSKTAAGMAQALARSEWRTTGSFSSGSDQTATGYSTARSYDHFPAVETMPDNSTTPNYLIFDFGTPGIAFDSVAIVGHNFGSMLTTVSVDIEIANDTAFSSGLRTIGTIASMTAGRVCWLSLGIPAGASFEAYTGVQYARVKMTGIDRVPTIGQVVFGTRYQMSQRSNVPYDDQEFHSNVVDFVSQGGHLSRYVRHSGRRDFNLAWTPTGADAYGLDDLTTLRSWFAAIEYGSKPFLFIDQPEAEKHATGITKQAHYVTASPDLALPAKGPSERSGAFSFSEIAPFVSSED